MAISQYINDSMQRSSWIRKMFEEGGRLKKEFGDENVFDFSLGNPDLEPPEEFFSHMRALIEKREKGVHGYMPNAGFTVVRAAVAKKVKKDHGVDVPLDNILMTCGAAGGLNTVLKTILNPGEEVIVPRPYFVEYGFYVQNHNGVLKAVDTAEDFSLNIDAIERAINDKTKAILINSPNNPTGRIYPESQIKALAAMLEGHKKKGRLIYLISDEPYREIAYNREGVPCLFTNYTETIVVSSFSKTLSVPGERIGYIAVHPSASDLNELIPGLILSNRILGYVNAPALMQRVVSELLDTRVDVETYRRRRDIFVEGLKGAGYELTPPEGAFYIFCKSPLPDDVAFVNKLLMFNVLVVPGVGFGGPGYFRVAYCVPESVISRSIPKFAEALKRLT